MIRPRLLPHTITYTPQVGIGASGPVFGEPVTVRARVQHERRLVRDKNGAQSVSAGTIYLRPGRTPAVSDRVTVPGVTGGREVIAVEAHTGRRDVELVTVDFA